MIYLAQTNLYKCRLGNLCKGAWHDGWTSSERLTLKRGTNYPWLIKSKGCVVLILIQISPESGSLKTWLVKERDHNGKYCTIREQYLIAFFCYWVDKWSRLFTEIRLYCNVWLNCIVMDHCEGKRSISAKVWTYWEYKLVQLSCKFHISFPQEDYADSKNFSFLLDKKYIY